MLLRIFLVASAFGSLVLLVLIYALLTGQACGTPAASPSAGESGSPAVSVSPSVEPSVSASALPSVPASAAPSGPSATVTIAANSFGEALTVAAGTTVVFDNTDPVPHTATNGTDGKPADGVLFDLALDAGASASYTFADPGSYAVTCKLHPFMNVTITVQ